MLLALARLALIVETAVGSLDCLTAATSWCGLGKRVGLRESIGLGHWVGGCESGQGDCKLISDLFVS